MSINILLHKLYTSHVCRQVFLRDIFIHTVQYGRGKGVSLILVFGRAERLVSNRLMGSDR